MSTVPGREELGIACSEDGIIRQPPVCILGPWRAGLGGLGRGPRCVPSPGFWRGASSAAVSG
jgi:hypothetical protein